MQRELFNYMFGSSLYSFSYTGPLRGSHDAEVAHGENEFDTPTLEDTPEDHQCVGVNRDHKCHGNQQNKC